MRWKKVQFNDELEEFKRTALFFDENPKSLSKNLTYLKSRYKIAVLLDLKDDKWKKLQNSDSWKTTTFSKIESAIKANNEPRSIENVVKEITMGSPRAPIALRLGDGTFYLVAGNTRLMVARTMKIQPQICVCSTDW